MKEKLILLAAIAVILPVVTSCGNVTQRNLIRHSRQVRGRPTAATHCVLRINEINTDSNNQVPSLFIELKRVCVEGRRKRRTVVKSLAGYYIIIVRAYPPAVVFVADLHDRNLNSDFLFTIGDSTVPNVDLDIKHGNVQSIFNHDTEKPSLPNGIDSPYGILLLDSALASTISRFRLVKLGDKFIERPVSQDDIMYILQQQDNTEPNNEPPFLLDMVVYGSLKTPATGCDLFDPLFLPSTPMEGGKRYLLRDWDTTQKIKIGNELVDVKDYSLNRCTESTAAFTPASFQYDTPTPGKPNPCQGASFFLEDIINKVADVNVSPMEVDPTCSAEDPQVPAGRYPLVHEAKFAEIRDFFCADQSGVYRSNIGLSEESMDIAVSHGEISDSGIDPEPFKIGGSSWEDEWKQTAKAYFPNDGQILAERQVQDWLRITIPGGSTPIKFHCAACVSFFEDEMGNVMRKTNIMTPEGYFNERQEKNSIQIRRHMKDDIHITAMNYQYQLAAAESDEQREAIRKDSEKQYEESLLPTAKMIRTVFAEVISETPFIYHEVYVNLQQTNGIFLGHHHYHAKAAAQMTETISSTMHLLLLKHLKEKNQPFTIILDTSTTKRNIPLLIIYIQTLEDGYPVTYYFKIIELPAGESAEATFNEFWKSLEKDNELVDGFLEFFVRKIAFFTSDSASVMVGIRNSFYTRLRDKTPTKTLGQVGCMAHKMALVIKEAVRGKVEDENFAYLQKFEKSINSFYGFYSSRGSKRFQHLAETAEKYDMKVFRLRKNIEVRWAAAEYEVVDNILKDWDVLEKDLEDISLDDDNFNKNAQEQAKSLHDSLINVGNLVLYHEFIDFLGVNKVVSKALQSRASILADHAELISNSLTQYHLLQNEYGVSLKKFLSEVRCPEICEISFCSLEDVENCNNAIYKGVELIQNPSFKMFEIRAVFYQKLFNAMNHYFQYELIESMKIFDHRMNKDIPDKMDFKIKFVTVCESFSIRNWGGTEISCENLADKFHDFLTNVMSTAKYEMYFGRPGEVPPSQFWPMVLGPDGGLNIDVEVKLFFEYLLVHSDSSAEAERGFSFANRISSDARSGMKAVTLDSLLRIKLNANKPIQELKAFIYAKEFAKKHYVVDSETAGGYRKVKKESVYNERVSRLF